MTAEAATAHPEAERVELWLADEARAGQQGRVTHVWYERGVRPRGGRDLGFASAYLFAAAVPASATPATSNKIPNR